MFSKYLCVLEPSCSHSRNKILSQSHPFATNFGCSKIRLWWEIFNELFYVETLFKEFLLLFNRTVMMSKGGRISFFFHANDERNPKKRGAKIKNRMSFFIAFVWVNWVSGAKIFSVKTMFIIVLSAYGHLKQLVLFKDLKNFYDCNYKIFCTCYGTVICP